MVKTAGMKCVAKSVVLCPQSSLPTGEEGKLVYDNATKSIQVYDGAGWVNLAPSTAVVDAYNPNYIQDVCEDFTTTDPYTLCTDGINTSQQEHLISVYHPVWNPTPNTILTCCNCILSEIYNAETYINQWWCGNGITVSYMPCREFFCAVSCAPSACDRGETCIFSFIDYKPTNQDINSDIYMCACLYTAGESHLCNFHCCQIFNCAITVCVCPADNCIYTSEGDHAFDFTTHGFLCKFEIRKCMYAYANRGSSSGSAYACVKYGVYLQTATTGVCYIPISNCAYSYVSGVYNSYTRACIVECCLCITGTNLSYYDSNKCYATSCTNITLPNTYKMIMPSTTGAVRPLGVPLQYDLCIEGIGDYNCQKNFDKICGEAGFNCLTNVYTWFCVGGDVSANCFNYCSCTDCLLCCWCLDTPCYNYYISPTSIAVRYFLWEEIQ